VNLETVGVDFASLAEGIVRDQPDPPRVIKLWKIIAFYHRRWDVLFFYAFAAIAAFPAIAVLGASGPEWLRVAVFVSLIAVAAFAFCAPTLAAILLTRTLRHGLRAKGHILNVSFVSGTGIDHGSRFARGQRTVDHPGLGRFDDAFDIRWRWGALIATGDELELLVDPRRRKVVFTLGPPASSR
jgi:hypothetical protein